MKKLALVLALSLALTASTLAVQQSHPFSQIIPQNSADFQGQNLKNINGGVHIGKSQDIVAGCDDQYAANCDPGIGGIYGISFNNQDGYNIFQKSGGEMVLAPPGNVRLWGGLETGTIQPKASLDNAGLNIEGDLDMNDNAIHKARAIYIGGSGYADNLAPGFIGHNSVENRIALYSTTDKAVTIGFAKDSSGSLQSDLLVTGDLEVEGQKNFLHDLNSTHEAAYTASESPEAAIEYTGSVKVSTEGTFVEFPRHFQKVLSEDEEYHVIATPTGTLADVGVFEKTAEGFKLKADRETTVDYHVRGIRDGYESRNIIRKVE